MANIIEDLKNLTNRAFNVNGSNGLFIALGILVAVLLIIIIPSAVAAANASTAVVTASILNGDKIYLKYNDQYLSVSSSNTWALSDTPRALQIELQQNEGETYKTGDPILTKNYFKLKDVKTGLYATVEGTEYTGNVYNSACTYSWTSTPNRFFLGGTDTTSLSTVENVAIVHGNSFALKAIDGVCRQGFSIYPSGSSFTYSTTNKPWQILKVDLAN